MIAVNDIFTTVCRLINKQANTAYKDFNIFFPQAELQLFQGELPRESSMLRPFMARLPMASNIATVPADFARVIAVSCNNRPVKVVEPEMLAEYHLASKITPPTTMYPIAVLSEAILELYPSTVKGARLEYYRYPRKSKWGFSLDSKGRPQYDAATSIDSEFPKECFDDLILKVCSLFGISIKAADITQYSEAKQQKN